MKKNILLATLSGLLLGCAWPMWGLPFLIFFALVPLLFVLDELQSKPSKHQAAQIYAYSFWTFLLWNLITTYWLFNASILGGSIAILFNTNAYAILMVLFCWIQKRKNNTAGYFFLIVSWLSYEKINLEWELSWPWLNLGNAFASFTHWIQWYEYTGVFGGSLWVLVSNLFILKAIHRYLISKRTLMPYKEIVFLVLWIAIPVGISYGIYNSIEEAQRRAKVVVIQPNIDPYEQKYTLSNKDLLQKALALSEKYLEQQPDFVLTPEGFFDEGLGLNLSNYKRSDFYSHLKNVGKQYPQTAFLHGAQTYRIYPKSTKKPSATANPTQNGVWFDVYNSALHVQHNHKDDIYHKSKLVPGVEFMPYKKTLEPILGQFLLDFGGTLATRGVQKDRTVFTNKNGITTAPIICYESIYGAFTTDFTRKGAAFFSIITNDAWWGNTPGHRQLLAYARLRAIENRRAIARAANTGISAFINAKGEIEKSLPYLTSGASIHSVELRTEQTFYATYGDFIPRWAGFFTFMIILIAMRKRNDN